MSECKMRQWADFAAGWTPHLLGCGVCSPAKTAVFITKVRGAKLGMVTRLAPPNVEMYYMQLYVVIFCIFC